MPIFLDQNGQGLVGFTLSASWAASYIAILIVMAVALALNVSRFRRPKRIGIGDGGDRDVMTAMRVHGNYVENVPFALAVLIMLPLLSAPVWAVHLVGLGMVAARILHAVGLSRSQGASFGRLFGILINWVVLLSSAILLIWLAWR